VVCGRGKSYSTTSRITSFMQQSEALILRWADFPDSPSRELPVEMVDDLASESVIRVALRISEATPVSLLGPGYMVNGIVRSCRPEKDSFLVTIVANDESTFGNVLAFGRDPGSLLVDDFLTEEEEAKILEGLQDSAACSIESMDGANAVGPSSSFGFAFWRYFHPPPPPGAVAPLRKSTLKIQVAYQLGFVR
jgi:hypothetical protein